MIQNKNNKQKLHEPIDLLDVLLDEDNCDPITLMDSTGKEMDFEQVAVIPHEIEGKRFLFVVLKPLDEIPGIADDEALVFRADTDVRGNTILTLEENESIAIDVFDKYYDLLETEQKAKRQRKGGKK